MVTNNRLIPEVRSGERGLNELGVVGFVRKVVLFCFCLAEGEMLFFESQLIQYLYIDVTGVWGDDTKQTEVFRILVILFLSRNRY